MKTRICFFLTLLASAFLVLPVFGAADGSIVGWGNNGDGRATPPTGSNYIAISAGLYHSLALRSDGSIVGWGWNYYGQATPPPGNNYIAISAGWYHSLALKSDGTIVGWGNNEYGQATLPAGNNFIAISAGGVHSLALRSDGTIVGWGDNYYDQATPPAGNDFIAISAGGSHSLGLKQDGSIVAWGDNGSGQATPPAGNNFIAISAGGEHSLGLEQDGSIVAWGANGYWEWRCDEEGNCWEEYVYTGQCDIPSPNTGFIRIAAGGYHSLAIRSDGTIAGWGAGTPGSFGWPHDGQATPPAGNNYIAISAGEEHSLALRSDPSAPLGTGGRIVGWGYNYYDQATPRAGNNFIAIAAGEYHSLALRSDGTIVGWGYNRYGQATPPAGNYVAISAGGGHSLAIRWDLSAGLGTGGSIVAWGNNWYGQATPPSGNNYIAIAAGALHSLALRSDGSIVGWGANGSGQASPPAGNNFIAITAGENHSLALRSDGSIVGWGYNGYGQATPPTGNNFIAIAAGPYYSLALRSDPSAALGTGGSIVGWGYNSWGQATPPPGNNYIAISAGGEHSLALRSDGTIVGWGRNNYDQAHPPTGNNFIAIIAGGEHSLALRGILTEISSTESALRESLYAKHGILDNGQVIGDMNGVFDFNNFDTVTITTGPWAGKGFSKGDCQATLEGVAYKGIWHGFLFLKPQERKIYLKGSTSGEIAATVEGYLTESVPDSNIYDRYQATWKVGRLGDATTSPTINLNGALSYQSTSEFPATALYILQSSIGGTVSGHYVGPLSSVINHIRIADSNNPYFGEGFSIISYVSEAGQGEGWTHDKVVSPGIVEMKGLFDSPLFGIVSGTLDETKTPRTVSANVQRVDLGLPPAPDLRIKTWGPSMVSPGQIINYIIEYRNDGLKSADEAIVFYALDTSVKHISASTGGSYDDFYHEVGWNLGKLAAKTTGHLSVKVEVPWGLSWGTMLDNSAFILNIVSYGTEASSSSNKPNLYLGGINNAVNSNNWKKADAFASEVIAEHPKIYGKGCVPDSWDVRKATPVYYKVVGYDGDGNPIIFDPITGTQITAPSGYKILTNDDVNYCVYYGSPNKNDNNGLTKDEIINGDFDTVYAYSGGTRTALTAILHEKLKCKRLVLISPMAGPGIVSSDSQPQEKLVKERYKLELELVLKNYPELEIVIYQSQKDKLWFGECYQVKFGPEDKEWFDKINRDKKRIKVNPGTEEFGLKDPLVIDVMDKDGKIVKKALNIKEDEINKQNHGGLFKYIEDEINKLQGKEGKSSSASTAIAVAHDPNRKLGPDGRVLPGQTLNYTVEYENEGEGIAFGVYFTDTLDEDLDYSTLEIGPVNDVNTGEKIAEPGIYDPATRTITWFVGQVDPNQGGYTEFNINVKSDARIGNEIINFATVYFPSVPEETRTNGVVSVVTIGSDINRDLNVNLFDFAILAEQWMQPPAVPSADIAPQDGDGIIDWQDLRELTAHWLEGTTP